MKQLLWPQKSMTYGWIHWIKLHPWRHKILRKYSDKRFPKLRGLFMFTFLKIVAQNRPAHRTHCANRFCTYKKLCFRIILKFELQGGPCNALMKLVRSLLWWDAEAWLKYWRKYEWRNIRFEIVPLFCVKWNLNNH